MKPLKTIILLALACLVLAGCAGLDRRAALDALRQDPGAGALIEGVPFFPQDEQMCGPAALAGVMAYWGSGDAMDEVAASVYSARLKGTLPIDLLLHARERGMEASYYRGGFDDLREKLSMGEPLILFLNLGYEFYPVGHYIVAVGVSESLGAVVAHSGMEREKVYSIGELGRAWARTGYSTLHVRPRGRR